MKKIYLMYPQKIGKIEPEIYGHFTEHIGGVVYDGIWVGKDSKVSNIRGFRKDIIEKLRAIKTPVIRWPGGCYAEVYDWRDGLGENRPTRINWWTREDGKYEPNEVGTHEFMDFCELVGAKAYFAANLTSVPPLHIRNWMDYCLSPKGTTTLALEREKNGHPEPFDIPYWGVGNENWGGGGNMTPQHYSDEFRRYAALMNNAFPDKKLIASGENAGDYSWTHGFISAIEKSWRCIHGYAMHYYCSLDHDPLNFTPEQWDDLLYHAAMMEDLIQRNWHIICAHGMEKNIRLVIDEWGCWHRGGTGPSKGGNLFEQQSTMRDAMVTALTLNIFNNHCEKILMANAAQLVNNLHALFLSAGEHCIQTPTYYVYSMFQEHQDAQAIRVTVTDNEELRSSLSVSASCKDGKTLVTVGNLSCTEDVEFTLEGVAAELPDCAEAELLWAEDYHAYNTFDTPDRVQPVRMQINPRKPVRIPKAGILSIRFSYEDNT